GGLSIRTSRGDRRRLTPTCVGRTRKCPHARPTHPAHPHVRGEDHSPTPPRDGQSGSPPRAWGGRCGGGPHLPVGRLTPTCVGRTQRWRRERPPRPAHPHVRGEDRGT